jgi:hypothetical protein
VLFGEFDFLNLRPAFVFLIAIDHRGNILSKEIGHDQQQVSLQPAQFVLDPPAKNEEKRQMVSIKD